MTGQEALYLVDTFLHATNRGQGLKDVQSVVFLETWEGSSYREIAQQLGYEYDYIKQVGSRLWRSLSQLVGEPVSKRNIHAVLRRYQQSQHTLIVYLPYNNRLGTSLPINRGGVTLAKSQEEILPKVLERI